MQQGTEEGRVVLGQQVVCRDGQRRVWRAIDLLRQTERAAKQEGALAERSLATAAVARRRAVGE
ncbi:MAG TPA: hypothetical protein VNF74_07170 [Terriglobales bacterium]|nr:hypothetical protein [Terriglobales bacterium]